MTSMKSSGLPQSRLEDFLEIVWTYSKSSGLDGSLLTKSSFHNRSQRFGSLPDYFHFSRLDFLKVVWTS
ncbi:hypothetical protein YC2023_123137 [Brassica napus]